MFSEPITITTSEKRTDAAFARFCEVFAAIETARNAVHNTQEAPQKRVKAKALAATLDRLTGALAAFIESHAEQTLKDRELVAKASKEPNAEDMALASFETAAGCAPGTEAATKRASDAAVARLNAAGHDIAKTADVVFMLRAYEELAAKGIVATDVDLFHFSAAPDVSRQTMVAAFLRDLSDRAPATPGRLAGFKNRLETLRRSKCRNSSELERWNRKQQTDNPPALPFAGTAAVGAEIGLSQHFGRSGGPGVWLR